MGNLLSLLSVNLTSEYDKLAQTVDQWAGLPWYVWLLLFIVAVIFVWWRLSRSAAYFNSDDEKIVPQDADDHGEHDTTGVVEEKAVDDSQADPSEDVDSTPEDDEPGDDLTRIEGIGPKISGLLGAAGIKTYAQLAESDPATLDKIVEEAGLHMADVNTWPDQARLAADGQWDALSELQDGLKAGRST